jgi:Flp pilus assembly protein TadG
VIRRRLQRRPDERGSAAVEAAILAPPLLVLIGLAIVGGRIQIAGGAIEGAAHDAARAASISRTAEEAQANAQAAAAATLGQDGLHCASLTVVVNTAGFDIPVGRPASVSATVTCVVDFSDLIADGLPGSKTLTSTFVSALDTFRTRALGFAISEARLATNSSVDGA